MKFQISINFNVIVLPFPLLLHGTGNILSSVREITKIEKKKWRAHTVRIKSETGKWSTVIGSLAFYICFCYFVRQNNSSYYLSTAWNTFLQWNLLLIMCCFMDVYVIWILIIHHPQYNCLVIVNLLMFFSHLFAFSNRLRFILKKNWKSLLHYFETIGRKHLIIFHVLGATVSLLIKLVSGTASGLLIVIVIVLVIKMLKERKMKKIEKRYLHYNFLFWN